MKTQSDNGLGDAYKDTSADMAQSNYYKDNATGRLGAANTHASNFFKKRPENSMHAVNQPLYSVSPGISSAN